MATDAIVVLERLTCIRESDGSGHSEPYIWPVLIWIDDGTLHAQPPVGATSPTLGNSRIVIKDGMRAGQVADIPSQVGILRVRLDDNQNVRQLILAVALWENDETPETAMREGYTAFAGGLVAALSDLSRLLALSNATTPEQRQPIIDMIKAEVRSKVESAIRNGLTGPQKVRVFLGTLNLDDIVGSDFKHFPQLLTQPFSMSFASDETPPSNRYTIDGQLQAVPVAVDPCGAFVTRVRAAQKAVDDIENEIRSLQAQLRGQTQPGEPRLPKAFITAEIARIRAEELPPAEAALDAARAALAICRNRQAIVAFPDAGEVVATL